MNIPEQRISEPEMMTAVVHLLLTDPGKERATRAFMIDGQPYSLTVERIDGSDYQRGIEQELESES